MGIKYSASESQLLIQAMSNNIEVANEVSDRLSSGSDHLIAALNSGELMGAAYTAGKGLFEGTIIPAIKKLQDAIDDIQTELTSYKTADSKISMFGDLDMEALKEEKKEREAQLTFTQEQIKDSSSILSQLGDLFLGGNNISQLYQVEAQVKSRIREVEEKIQKLEYFVNQVSQYFTDSLEVLNLAIQGASQLSQVLFDSEGNYSVDGVDMSWLEKIKKSKIKSIHNKNYSTFKEEAIGEAIKEMKVPDKGKAFYIKKLEEKIEGQPRSKWKKIIDDYNKDLKRDSRINMLQIFSMSREEIEEEFDDIAEAYNRGDTNDYRWRGKFTNEEWRRVEIVLERYPQTLIEEPGISPRILKKVDPDFKKKIDGMTQKQLEEEYPGFKRSPLAPFYENFFYTSETDSANTVYLVNRYIELDSLNPVSKHDPDFEQKRFEYINKTGIDPVTNKEADKDLKNYAKNYTTFAPGIKAGYDFLMVGVSAWNMNAYNKELQAQKADETIDEYTKTKEAFRRNQELFGNTDPLNESFNQLNTNVDTVDLPDGIWKKGNSERGFYIDENLKGGNNVGKNYPVIDRYDPVTETATSVKSRDLNAKTYQNGSKLKSTIKQDINQLKDFELQNWGDVRLEGKTISNRELDIVVPNTKLNNSQITAINDAIDYGQANGVKINIIVGGN